MAELNGQSTFAKKYQLETQIRGTQQGDRTIQEFHGVMVGLWDQLAKLENRDLSMRSSYKEYREEQRLVQFLISLRDEFEPLRKSILCRCFLPSVKQAVSELAAEEMRLKSSIVSSKFSDLSLKTDQSFKIGKVEYGYGHQRGDLNAQTSTDGSVKAYGYIGGFDQSHKYSKPSSSQDRSALSSSMPATDQPSFIENLAKVANASFTAVKVARELYNIYTEFGTGTDSRTLKILSYNVWFREDMEMHKRMKALGDLIQLHSPDLICFQEVTANIYGIFQQSSWWKLYRCSVSNEKANTRRYFCMQLSKLPVESYSCKPFNNSTMQRELCVAEVEVHADMSLVVATSHLESPCPAPPTWDQMFSKERVYQAKEALNFLKKNANVIFCGDMNWDDELDGQFPLPNGWVDAWVLLKPGENGWTYDTKSNQMLSGNRPLQKRLDRFVCNLRDFRITKIDMIGMEAIPGLSYCKEKNVNRRVQKLMLPVLPSDHYGLLLTICAK